MVKPPCRQASKYQWRNIILWCSWRVPIVLFVKRKQDVQIYIHKKRCKAPITLEKWIELHSITISGSSLKTTMKIGIFNQSSSNHARAAYGTILGRMKMAKTNSSVLTSIRVHWEACVQHTAVCVVTQSLSVEWQSLPASTHPSVEIFEFLLS